ncbi:cupin [Bacteroidia bacterium]|nr:cupin [Bacteroidia bacterium]
MKTSSKTYQVETELPWEPAGEGVERQVMGYDGQLMLVKVRFKQGAVGTLHSHPHSQASYVASGTFELLIGAEKKVLQTGDGYYVEPGLLHGCVCLEPGVLIDAFSPVREDFLSSRNGNA